MRLIKVFYDILTRCIVLNRQKRKKNRLEQLKRENTCAVCLYGQKRASSLRRLCDVLRLANRSARAFYSLSFSLFTKHLSFLLPPMRDLREYFTMCISLARPLLRTYYRFREEDGGSVPRLRREFLPRGTP